MNRQECKNGLRVKMYKYSMNGFKRQGVQYGNVIKMYSNYVLVKLDVGYNECFMYNDLTPVKSKKE